MVAVTDQAAPSASSFNLGGLWGEAKDLIKFGVAAKYAPQSLNNPSQAAPATPGTPAAGGGKTLGDAIAPLVGVYAADQAIARTNKNVPWIIYVPLGMIFLGGVAYLYRPVRR